MAAVVQQVSNSPVMAPDATVAIQDGLAAKKMSHGFCSVDEAETVSGASSDMEPFISSSGSDQASDDEIFTHATSNFQDAGMQEQCIGAPQSQIAGALLQLCSLGRAREIIDVSAADDRQPCWLASGVSGFTMVQPTLQEFAPERTSVFTCQLAFLPGSSQGSPPAPPPGLPAPSSEALERSQQEGGAVVQSGDPSAENSPKDSLPSPSSATSPALSCTCLSATSARVTWTVDAKKFMSKDKMLVSPAFDLPMARPVPFRMMVQPKETPQKGGGFEKARGRGSIQLKCHGDLSDEGLQQTLKFKLSVGKADWRGPVGHDFAEASVAGLPAGRGDWNFRTAAGASPTVTISLEVECA